MKLSIIVPVYNTEKYLAKCLDSLLDQDIESSEYEIIIVNDGSTDNSESIAMDYSKKFSHINTYTQKNGGVGSARNYGLDRAHGDYVYLIDPDDYLKPNVLGLLVQSIDNLNLDILTFSWTTFFDGNSKKLMHEPKVKQEDKTSLSEITSGINYIANNKYKSSIWWYLIKRTFLKETKIRFIEGRWMEDAIFTTQLFIKAKRMADLPIKAHMYRVAPGTAMTSKRPGHYLKLIRDINNAVHVFETIIIELKNNDVNPKCIDRVKTRQQAFVFFLLVRIMQSTMKFSEVKKILDKLIAIKAYPLNSFVGEDYNHILYKIVAVSINSKYRFYSCFKLFNPLFRLRYRLTKDIV